MAGVVPDSTTLICRSTTEDGGDWLWTLLKCEVGALRPPVGAGAARTAPAGVAPASVNWVCTPAQPHQKWNPSAAEIAALKQEASLLGLHVKGIGMTDAQITVPGRGMNLIPLVVQQPGPGAAMAQGPREDVAVPGPGPAAGGGGGESFNLQSLADVIQELKDMAKQSKGEDKKRKGKKKKKKKSDKKRRRREALRPQVQGPADPDQVAAAVGEATAAPRGPCSGKARGRIGR